MPAPRRSSRPVTRSLKSAQVAQERRSTVPTRARRKVSFSSLPTTSFANCPVAVYSVSTASSSLFDISPPRTRLTSLTEINVKKGTSLSSRTFSVFHSLSHHSALTLSSPRASLRPRSVVFRSFSSLAGPAHTDGGRGGGGANVASHAPTHHEPGPGLASLQHAALPGRPLQRAAAVVTSRRIVRIERGARAARLAAFIYVSQVSIRPLPMRIVTLIKVEKQQENVS